MHPLALVRRIREHADGAVRGAGDCSMQSPRVIGDVGAADGRTTDERESEVEMLRAMKWRQIGGAVVLAVAASGCGRDEPVATPEAAEQAPAVEAGAAASAAVDGPVTLVVAPAAVAGQAVSVTWTGPANPRDYIDIVPRGHAQTHGEITYRYMSEASAPAIELVAPTAAGEYDVRYVLDTGDERLVKATVPLSVTAASATLAAPTEALGGAELAVTWTGPAGDGDYIDLVPADYTLTHGELTYAYTKQGSPAMLRLPAAGNFAVRYVQEGPGGRVELARTMVRVTSPTATVTSAASAAPAAAITVAWTGPNNAGDYVDLVPKGSTQTSGELAYFYTSSGASGSLAVPAEPGEYEIRYVMEATGGRVVLARQVVIVEA